ncbi:hypothetical protein O3M35_008928 [Rhynocoris fuscipes]
MGETEEPTLMQAQSIIVIHPGSLYLKIGRASDLNPHTELHALARRRLNGDLSPHTDRLLPPIVCKLKDIEAELDKCRLSISHCLQSCPMSDGQRRYATPPQQIAQYNRRSRPEPVNNSIITDWVKPEADVVVGAEVLNINPEWDYNIHFPIKRGELNIHAGVGGSLTAVLADLECIWGWVIQTKLHIQLQDLKNYRAVLVIPDIYNRQYLRELTNMLLQMGFSSCFLLQDHVGATFGAGLGTACVVDCGHSKTSVSCVEDGITQPATRVRLPYGGGDITQCLFWLLNKCGFPYKDCNPLLPLDALLLEKFKQESCHVDLDVCGCRERSFIINQPQREPVRYTVQVGDECMIAPLSLFQPELLNLTGPKVMVTQKRNTGDPSDPHDSDYLRETGRKGKEAPEAAADGGGSAPADEEIVDIEMTGDAEFNAGPPSQLLSIDQAILQSIQRCASDDLKKKMYSCILVVGGGMKFRGISNWLQKKISLQIPPNFRPEQTDIVTTPMDPMIVAWKGAAILACLESAHELWITKAEWEKYAVKVLRERSPFIW